MEAEPRGVLVTGGSAGIGLATAKRFAELGDKVVIMGRSEEALDAAREELADQGLDIGIYAGSVANANDAEAAVAATVEAAGAIDVIVNNAGVCLESPVAEMSEADWDQTFDVNIKGVFLPTRAALQRMVPRRKGVVLVTSSINARGAEPLYAAYSATKAGVDAFVSALSVEVAEHNIRVCAVAPGYIETPMQRKTIPDPEEFEAWRPKILETIPMKRFGRPEEIAAAFAFLASEEAGYVTGSVVTVDGGWLAG